MKKITLLVLTTLMMVGCTEKDSNGHIAINTGNNSNPSIVIIDSCEYIRCYTDYGNYIYFHKGNCLFCKERRQKELKEFIEQLNEK